MSFSTMATAGGLGGFGMVLGDALASVVHDAEPGLGFRVSLLNRLMRPLLYSRLTVFTGAGHVPEKVLTRRLARAVVECGGGCGAHAATMPVPATQCPLGQAQILCSLDRQPDGCQG